MKDPEVRKSRGPEVSEWRPMASFGVLRQRAELVERTRQFFRERGVLEVDVPVLQGGANCDRGVVPFRVETADGPRFLPTSPEHPLKRLICAGSGAIWTLAPAFRSAEHGRKHRSEFRMLEWYRPGWDDIRLCDEVIDLFDLLTGYGRAQEHLTWRDSFRRHASLDPLTASDSDLRTALGTAASAARDRRECLDLLLSELVEPHLGRNCWTVLTDYPPEAAAQARIRTGADGTAVAARFEVYRNGIELANGYWELDDGAELARRLESERTGRDDPSAILHDARFAAAMHAGLGDCAGVAVGFDRVVMLALGLNSVAETMAFPWEEA